MSLFTHIRDQVEGVAAPIASTIAVGLPSLMIGSGSAAVTGLAGLLGGGGQLPSGGGGGMMSQSDSSSTDMGYQNSIAGLMQMIGQQPPQIASTGMASSSTGGLI